MIGTIDTSKTLEANGYSRDARENLSSELKVDGENLVEDDEMNDSDWEDGSIPDLHTTNNNNREHIDKGVTIEFDASPDSAKRKPIRRASAEEKVNCIAQDNYILDMVFV